MEYESDASHMENEKKNGKTTKGKIMATKQAIKKAAENRKRKPSPINGQVLPAGFEAHPERRHNGAWKKEDTLRFKLQQIAKMTEEELSAVLEDETAGLYEKQVARTILSLGGVDPNKRWQILEGLTNQDGGYPKQSVEQKNIEIKPILPKKEKK